MSANMAESMSCGFGSLDQMSMSHLYREQAGLVCRDCREGDERSKFMELRWSDTICAFGMCWEIMEAAMRPYALLCKIFIS